MSEPLFESPWPSKPSTWRAKEVHFLRTLEESSCATLCQTQKSRYFTRDPAFVTCNICKHHLRNGTYAVPLRDQKAA